MKMILITIFMVFLYLCTAGDLAPATSVNSPDSLIDSQIALLKNHLKQNQDTKKNSAQNADLWRRLGMLLQTKDVRQHVGGGALQPEALEAFNKALKLNDDRDISLSVQVYQYRGILLKMMGRGEEAILSHDSAFELATVVNDKCEALSNKAAALVMLGRVSRAVELYRQAIKMCKDKLSLYLPLVLGYQELGTLNTTQWTELLVEIERALEPIFRAQTQLPPAALGYLSSDSAEYAVKENATEGNVELVEESVLASVDGSSVFWALYEISDKLGHYDKSWIYLSEAHRLELARRPLDVHLDANADIQQSQITSIFTKSFWPAGVGMKTKAPIFIIGMMRSGSTLMETMLDAHPQIWGMGEDSIFNGQLNEFRNELVAALGTAATKGMGTVKKVVNNHGAAIVDKMMKLAVVSTNHDALNKNKSKKTMKSRSKESSSKVNFVVDKMLFNYRNLGFIHLVYPKAVIIHTIRDPMDTLFSCYKHKFDDIGLEWALSPQHLVRQYIRYLEILHHFRTVLPGRIMDIRYESLVGDPEGVMRRILAALDLPWDPSVLNFYTTNRTVHTHSQSQVRHQISSKYIGVWRKYAVHLQPMIDEMRKHLPRLRRDGVLPFLNEMNWDLDPNFNYSITFAPPSSSPAVAAASPSPPHPPPVDVPNSPLLMHELLNNISLRAAQLASKSPSEYGMTDLQRALREQTLSSLYKEFRFRVSFGEGSRQPISEARAKEQIQQLKYRSRDDRVDEILAVGFVLISTKQLQKSADLFDRMLSALYFEPKVVPFRKKFQNSSLFGNVIVHQRKYEGLSIATVRSSRPSKASHKEKNKPKEQFFEGEGILMEDRDSAVGAMLGLGTSLALLGNIADSAVVFSDALQLNPAEVDLLKRRSEVFTSLGMFDNAIADIETIIELSNSTAQGDSDLRAEKGKIYIMQNKFHEAYFEFSAIVRDLSVLSNSKLLSVTTMHFSKVFIAQVYFFLGKCQMKFGDTDAALASFQTSRQFDNKLKENHLETAFTLMESARWTEALEFIDSALSLDPNFKNAFGYRGLLMQNLGRHQDAIQDFLQALSIDPNDKQCMVLSSVCYHAVGDFNSSYAMSQRLLSLDPRHPAWFRMESMLYSATRATSLLSSYNPDVELEPFIREGTSQGDVLPASQGKFKSYSLKLVLNTKSPLQSKSKRVSSIQQNNNIESQRFVTATAAVGKWIQLNSSGFLPNKRQHTSTGLAVLQMAQCLAQHIASRKLGKRGLYVSDAGASKTNYYGMQSCSLDLQLRGECVGGTHLFGWRDFFDIAVKWRQLSEPMDIVWWVDKLPVKDDFAKRLGLNTYLVRGYNKVVRYYPYFDATFDLTRDIIIERGFYDKDENLIKLSLKQKARVKKTTSLLSLFKALGQKNLFVVVPCRSSRSPHLELNGTRITIMESRGDTASSVDTLLDFSICSASTPERFSQYEEELHHAFTDLVASLERVQNSNIDSNDNDDDSPRELVLEAGLKLFYFWVNFAPLSRGTSATGYAALLATVLSMGEMFSNPVPRGKQLDWEAILSKTHDSFLQKVKAWLQTAPADATLSNLVASEDEEDHVSSQFSTAAAVTRVLVENS